MDPRGVLFPRQEVQCIAAQAYEVDHNLYSIMTLFTCIYFTMKVLFEVVNCLVGLLAGGSDQSQGRTWRWCLTHVGLWLVPDQK